VCSTVVVRCPLSICVSFLIYITESVVIKWIAVPLKCLSEENVTSELYLDYDSGEKLVDEESAFLNIHFFWFKREVIRIVTDDGTWRSEVILDTNIYSTQFGFGHNATPDTKDCSSAIEYSLLFLT
jgi:hypothetical protein